MKPYVRLKQQPKPWHMLSLWNEDGDIECWPRTHMVLHDRRDPRPTGCKTGPVYALSWQNGRDDRMRPYCSDRRGPITRSEALRLQGADEEGWRIVLLTGEVGERGTSPIVLRAKAITGRRARPTARVNAFPTVGISKCPLGPRWIDVARQKERVQLVCIKCCRLVAHRPRECR